MGRSSSNRKYGNKALLVEVTAGTGAIPGSLTADTNCFDLGDIEISMLTPELSSSKNKNEDGTVHSVNNDLEESWEFTLQSDDEILRELVRWGCKDKTYLLMKYVGIRNGKYLEDFMFVNPRHGLQDGVGSDKIKWRMDKVVLRSSATISAANLTAIETALSMAIQRSTDVVIPGGYNAAGYYTAATTVS